MEADPDDRDELGRQAQAYEEALESGSTDHSESLTLPEFENGHPQLAKVLRMLNAIFPQASHAGHSAADHTLTQAPTRIGRFVVERQLGRGSFGAVWLALDPVLKRDVAVKVAHVGIHAPADLLERFEREAHLAARLHHPNIVPVFETGKDEGRLYIVSEYCRGPALAEWLRDRDEPVSSLVAAQMVRQLADAAEHAHRQGLIHRDIKPGNVLLTGNESASSDLVPRLTDFGLARDLTSDQASTRTGEVVGTLKYMSPEQAKGQSDSHGPGTDIYSLGVLLYRLLTGTTPFKGDSDFDVIQKIAADEPTPPNRLRQDVPRDLSSICLKCLEKRPDQRYTTAARLRDDLDRFLRNEPTIARPISAAERMVRWAKRAPSAAALVLVSLVSFVAIVAGLSFYLQQAEHNAQDLAAALEDAKRERSIAGQARDDADVARKTAETQRQIARQTSYRSDVRLAFELFEQGSVNGVRNLLADQLPNGEVDLRGPEWFVLQANLNAFSRVLGYHDGAATECVLSPDGTLAYSSGIDGFVRTWDLRAGKETNTYHVKSGALHALAISPDGSTIAVGGQPGLLNAQVRLIDAASGEDRSTLQSHETTIESIAFSGDGRWLAAGSRYSPVQLTRLRDEETFELPSERRNRTLSFSADSQLLAVGADSYRVDIWPVGQDSPGEVHKVPGFDGGRPYIVRFAPNESLLATAYIYADWISLFDQPENIRRGTAMEANAHSQSARFKSLAFSPEGQFLAAGDEAGSIVTWDLNTDANENHRKIMPLSSFSPHVATVSSVQFVDESNLISSGEDGRVCLTSPSAGGAVHQRWSELSVSDAVVAGNDVYLGCEDGTIRRLCCDVMTGLTRRSQLLSSADAIEHVDVPEVVAKNPVAVSCLDVSLDGKVIAVGTRQSGIFLYDRTSGEMMQTVHDNLLSDDYHVDDISFSADGSYLAFTGRNDVATVLEVESEKQLLNHFVGNGCTVQFINGGSQLAASCNDDGFQFLDIRSNQVVHSMTVADVETVELSPDGNILACGQSDGRLRIIDVSTRDVKTVSSRRRRIVSLTFAANGRTVTSLDQFGYLGFVDVESGTEFGGVQLPDKLMQSFDHATLMCTDSWVAAIVAASTEISGMSGTDLYFWSLESPAGTSVSDKSQQNVAGQ